MPPEADGLPQPRRTLSVIAISLSIAMTVLDSSMLNVALPGIAHDLGITPATATWLLNAYQLTVVTTLLPLASLGESLGFRRVFLSGFVLFAGAALGAAMAGSFEALLGFRILQGLGASAVMSLTAGMIRHTYPAKDLGKALGINAMVVAVSGASAPSLAAAILAVAPWPVLFAVNVPVSLIGIAIGLRTLPNHPGTRRRFDLASAALNVATLGLFFLGLDLLLHETLPALALMAAAALAGTVLVKRQLSRPAPLLPVDLLRIRIIALSVLAAISAFGAWYASYVSLPFLLHGEGFSQVMTGLVMTPWPLGMALSAPLAGKLSDRVPSWVLGGIGMAVLASALAVISLAPLAGWGLALGGLMWFCGAGFGCFTTPNNRTMLGAAPKTRAGSAGGMQATARLLGTTLGTTVVGICFQVAGEDGPRTALLCAIGFAVLAGVLSCSRRGA
ncbi:MFS transporter [Siccirubricoccus sp. KC 17139]|uniref:MFS transporter n=1 Tax=Siccirubricoccus soli TaxID=2899147 RepID=A0ABT1DDI4_9PROT|nr:MFS transporter [Siccirubricoccus soli]MCP2686138.1 MFS transporter [Siccirubricoccus soli]